MALISGRHVVSARLYPHDPGAGRERSTFGVMRAREIADPWKRALCAVAGPVAGRMWDRRVRVRRAILTPGIQCHGSDAWFLVRRLRLDDTSLWHAWLVAESALRKFAPAVDAIAHVLLAADITGDDATAICRVAQPGAVWDIETALGLKDLPPCPKSPPAANKPPRRRCARSLRHGRVSPA